MKIVTVFLSLFLCLFGCGQKREATSWFTDNGKVKVLSTIAMIDDLVKGIGQDRVDSLSLIVGEIDPHSYELVKGDDEKIANAKIVICVGLGLEHGASLRYQMQKHPGGIFLGDEIQKKVPEKILKVEGETDPHVWMDISLWVNGIDAIVEALVKVDSANASFYVRNGKRLREEMLAAHLQLQREMLEVSEEKRYLVTSHDAFRYFTRAYLAQGEDWEVRCVAPEGLAPEGQLSTQDIKRVVDHLSQYKIGVVFPESNVSRDALKKIVSCCGHPVRCSEYPLYGDSMGTQNYLEMIRHNVHVLKEEWTR